MTYRKPDTSVHPLLWIALAALIVMLAITGWLIWSVWTS